MRDLPRVSHVSLFPLGRVSRRSGTYGWLTYELDGAPVFDGAKLRRAKDGTFYVSLPGRRAGNGLEQAPDPQTEAEERRQLESRLLDQLRRQGAIPA